MLHSTRKSAWSRSALLVVAVVLVMTMLAACGGDKGEHSLEFKGVSEGDVVATYKDGKVTQAEFDKYLAIFGVSQPSYEQIITIPQFQQMILEQYVSYKVLSSQASEDSLKKAREDVDKQLKEYKDYLKTDADLEKKVKEKKISDDDMATFLMLTSTVVAHVNSLVTDEDITKAYETAQMDYAVSTVRHILVATTEQNEETGETKELRTDEEALARAKEVKAKLDAGGSWDTLAKEYSDDPGSKDKGGLYADAEGKNWVEPFKKAAFEQEINKIGEPVKSDFGYHVMVVEKREPKTYDQLTDEQKEEVMSAAAYTYMEKFMSDEMPKQELKITLPEPSPSPSPDAEGEGETEGAEGEATATPSPSPTATEKPAE
ncbi:peptidylprolyl isomerase [Paenibacillus sp. LHD-117]|uniref:peptidylprolyl isomerase n=1 Tax=Paenibacillus sp. LHD-117 TaxID=3071412 RepID=UPI0027DEC422|nr:peptidylprolyl isomerase [Paenibacillus sp. LHD-117]MDQ6420752.1 peptidylprolyl isomerase [Paenibacillus sp. LHD-117]